MGLFGRKEQKRKRPRSMLICPQCGGSEIYVEAGQITGYKYHCKSCQYVGPFIVEKDVEDIIANEERDKRLKL